MKKTACIIIAILLMGCSQALANFSGGDNFNDNSMDTGKWSVFVESADRSLSEANNRLEFISSGSTEFGNDQASGWEWIGNAGSYTQNWSATCDSVNLMDETAMVDDWVSFGFVIFHESLADNLTLYHLRENDEGVPIHTAGIEANTGGIRQLNAGQPISSDSVALRLSFDAQTKAIHCSYDTGSGFNVFARFNVSGWGMADGDEFSLALYGETSHSVITSGQVYGDNFTLTPSAYFSEGPHNWDLYDDFNSGVLNTSSWSQASYNNSVSPFVSNGVVNCSATLDDGASKLRVADKSVFGVRANFMLNSSVDNSGIELFMDFSGGRKGWVDITRWGGNLWINCEVWDAEGVVIHQVFWSEIPEYNTVYTLSTIVEDGRVKFYVNDDFVTQTPVLGGLWPTGFELGTWSDVNGATVSGWFDNVYVLRSPTPPNEAAKIYCPPNTLVGSWITGDSTTKDSVMITFMADGSYFLSHDGVSEGGGYPGMERGTYAWNTNTGVFTATATVDTTGVWGLSHPDGTVTVTVDGDTLYYSPALEGTFPFQRVSYPSTPPSIVGGWVHLDPVNNHDNVVFTFLPNGIYFFAQDGDSAFDPSGQDGMERGVYSWDADTGTFSATALVDTCGAWGPDEITSASVAGNTLTLNGGFVLERVVDPQCSDLDGDGLPDVWEQQYFSNPTSATAGGHGDGDTLNNRAEYIAGTIPTSGGSVFEVSNFDPSPSGFVLNWTAIEGRAYSVLWTESLTNNFQTLESNITPPQNSYTDTVHAAEGGGFYNLKVELEN